jgi:hypothetical protein
MMRILPSPLLAIAVALLTASPAISEPRCSAKQFAASGAPGRIHFIGRRNARLAWAAAVRADLGDAYATWDRATSRNFDCTFSDWHYRCSATARPCRSFVTGR